LGHPAQPLQIAAKEPIVAYFVLLAECHYVLGEDARLVSSLISLWLQRLPGVQSLQVFIPQVADHVAKPIDGEMRHLNPLIGVPFVCNFCGNLGHTEKWGNRGFQIPESLGVI
jgi:hypothetical protein